MVHDEITLVTERHNSRTSTENTFLQMAVSGVLDKKANKDFHRQIEKLALNINVNDPVDSGQDVTGE